MRLEGRRSSSNVEDRRGVRLGRAGGIGLGTVVLALVAMYFGVDPTVLLQGNSGQPVQQQVPYEEGQDEARMRELVSVVLADTEDTWGQLFAADGSTYQQPKLVLFSGAVQSACGTAQAAV